MPSGSARALEGIAQPERLDAPALPAPSAPPAGARTAFIDNAKYLAMVLVVVGHVLEPALGHPAVRALYLALYAFHVPVFVFLAGHVSKPEASLASLARTLLAPLLVFQILYFGGLRAIGSDRYVAALWHPYWLLWFLLSLFCWKLLLKGIGRFGRGPASAAVALALSVAVALLAGAVPAVGHAFSVSRTLVFLPFFLGGYYLPRRLLTAPVPAGLRAASAAVLAALFAAAWLFGPRLGVRWLHGSMGYAALGSSIGEGVLLRAGILAVALVAGASFLLLVPSGEGRLTAWGRRSLQAYLLHGFFVLAAVRAGLLAGLGADLRGGVAVASAVLLATALSTRAAERLTRPLWKLAGR